MGYSGIMGLSSFGCQTDPTTITGKTNKPAWNKFSRQCMDRRKFPAQLATHFLNSKVDLFNEWLSCSEDWSKVVLNYERRVEDTKKFKKQRKGMKGRDIIAAYGETIL